MMDRRIFLTTVAGLLAAPLAAEAQQAAKVPRIGYLAATNLAANPTCQRPSVKDCVTSGTSRAATS